MFSKTFAKECSTNPFLWWSAIILVLSIFDSVVFTIDVLQIIVTWFIPILFASLTFVFIASFYPIRRGLAEFGRNESKKTAIGFLVLICLIFYTEIIYFMMSPYEIFARLFPASVLDKNTFNIDIYAKNLIEFLALPLLSTFTFAIIKNKLEGKYITNDKFTKNLKFVAYVVVINTLMYFLSVMFTSRIWADFVTWYPNHTGDIPTWILAIATPLSILVGFLMAKKQSHLNLIQLTLSAEQQKQEAKIEEQKFFFEIERIFSRSDNEDVRDKINDEVNHIKNMEMSDSGIKKKIDNYLNHLEFICNMYQEKIVSKKMIDAFVEGRITNAWECKSINNYIKNERIRTKISTLWEAIEQVYVDFHPKPQN